MRAAALAALAAAALAGCEAWGVDPDLERMIDQHRADPYEATTLFPDGRVLRAPPAGTVARDQIIGPSQLTEGTLSGQPAAQVPIPVDAELLALGRTRFDIVCATCHGLLGDGHSKVAENMRLRPPPSLVADPVRTYPPGRVFQAITRGYGLMPSLSPQLSLEERWAVVAYLQALQLASAVPLAELPPALRRQAEEALP